MYLFYLLLFWLYHIFGYIISLIIASLYTIILDQQSAQLEKVKERNVWSICRQQLLSFLRPYSSNLCILRIIYYILSYIICLYMLCVYIHFIIHYHILYIFCIFYILQFINIYINIYIYIYYIHIYVDIYRYIYMYNIYI